MPSIEPRLRVNAPNGEYGIFVGAGLLDGLGEIVESSGDLFSRRCAIVSTPTIAPLYGARVTAALARTGFEPTLIEIPDGEEHKTLETVRALYDRLLDARIDRRAFVCALGGGVLGDVAGFAAATILRGAPFIQIPTTLVAMVDASIGGKVGVDLPRGKNLVGAFFPPRAVIADVATLDTLPEVEWRCGMAEAVKQALIGDAGLLERWERRDWRLGIGDWLERAIRVKVEIVSRDPYEQGERAKLNLGHTFAHALEAVSGFRLRHGEAVAIGLVGAARLAAERGMCARALVTRVERLLTRIGLPTRVPREFSAAEIVAAMESDKKRVDGRLRFILPRGVGNAAVVEVAREEVREVIGKWLLVIGE